MFKFLFIKRYKPSNRIVCACALISILISANVSAEEYSLIDWKIRFKKQANFSVSVGSMPSVFNLVTETCKQGYGEVIEFFSLSAADGQPIAKKKADEKPKTSEKFGTVGDEIMDFLKNSKIHKIFLWFVFGVLCGYGPFGKSRYKLKPNH